jgi:F-type H+-transporting ATPase subunit alpha
VGTPLPEFLEHLEGVAAAGRLELGISEEGRVIAVGDGIARVQGLRGARLAELIRIDTGDQGIVFDLDHDAIGLVLLSGPERVRAGNRAVKTDSITAVGVGEALLGRVVDALGQPLDDGPALAGTIPYPVERDAPALGAREFVTEPLYTGIKVIDAMLPIGRGQRELIIGDPSTGKSSIAMDAVMNQKSSNVISVYVIVGQKKAQVLKVVEELREHGDFSRIVVVAADASAAIGMQYLAPYTGTAIAEYFRDRGADVLVVFDDLTKHAEAYRTLSLLLKRPPGREAYPGDIFYIHSRLLERAAKINDAHGGGSITALPIVETQQGRIASYIPTNLISITDGQIYLDAALVGRGIRPAVDVGMSVSRIGGKAQVPAMKSVAQKLKIDYARFMEVEAFTRFGSRLEEESARLIRRGERLREMLKQPRFQTCPLEDQVLGFLILESGALDARDLTAARVACRDLVQDLKERFPEIVRTIREQGRLEASAAEQLTASILRPA